MTTLHETHNYTCSDANAIITMSLDRASGFSGVSFRRFLSAASSGVWAAVEDPYVRPKSGSGIPSVLGFRTRTLMFMWSLGPLFCSICVSRTPTGKCASARFVYCFVDCRKIFIWFAWKHLGFVCIHIYIYICTYICIYVYIHTYTVCIYVYNTYISSLPRSTRPLWCFSVLAWALEKLHFEDRVACGVPKARQLGMQICTRGEVRLRPSTIDYRKP